MTMTKDFSQLQVTKEFALLEATESFQFEISSRISIIAPKLLQKSAIESIRSI
jgi:hypothetical protein